MAHFTCYMLHAYYSGSDARASTLAARSKRTTSNRPFSAAHLQAQLPKDFVSFCYCTLKTRFSHFLFCLTTLGLVKSHD